MSTRSEEVQDIIERMPTRWCAWTALIVSLLMGVLLLLSFLISYPDTVDGEVSITQTSAPIRLLANTSGRLHLLEVSNKEVEEGTIIAYIESGAKFDDILKLKKGLEDNAQSLPDNLNVGELSGSYNSYLLAVQYWQRQKNSERYRTMRKSIESQIASNQKIVDQLSENKQLKAQVRNNLQKAYERDSILAEKKIVSENELQYTQNNYLAKKEDEASLKSSVLSKQAEIKTAKIELAKSVIEEEEILEQAFTDMMSKLNVLQTELRLWEEKYVIKAPSGGQLEYLGFWRENTAVESGVELFTILPNHSHIIGEAHIPAIGAGKVKVGQKVNIKLYDYPYDEFGLLNGKVESISPLTKKMKVNNNTVETYLVRISLPDGGETNFGHTLSLNFETKGMAEIITKPKHLIERLFDNLKAKAHK